MLLAWAARPEAQQARAGSERSISPALVFYDLTRSASETPKSAVGLSAIVGRSLGPYISGRGSVGVWASLPAGDPVALCALLPDGGCAPDPVVPSRLWMAELHGLARILPVVPLYGTAGIGIALPQGERADSLPSSRTVMRAGLELGDGRRWGGLRLQFSRVIFRGGIRDLRSGHVFGAVIRL